MSNLVWTENTKPDRPGIWACKGHIHPYAATERTLTPGHHWTVGTWAFLMDLPTIVDPPRYRDVTAADVKRKVDLALHDGEWDEGIELVAILPETVPHRYVGLYGEPPRIGCWRYARILDTQPEARQAREWWLNLYPQDIGAHETEHAAVAMQNRNFLERVHVREVFQE